MRRERDLIDISTDQRYVGRDDQGRFRETDKVLKSLPQDARRLSGTIKPDNQGDKAH